MHVVRCRSPAVRPVVEDQVVLVLTGKVHHIHEVMPDRLWAVNVSCYHEMAWEDGVGVDLYIIVSVFAAFEFDMELLGRTVRDAEKAGPGRKRSGVHFSCGRRDTARVVLNLALNSTHFQFLYLGLLESAEIAGSKGPD